MGSSKKKKGQQRKAVARKALSTETASSGGVSGGINSSGGVGSGGDNDSKLVAKIRRGDNKATKRLVTEDINRSSFVESGIVSTALEFLNRCEDQTFDQVLRSVGGDLKSPSLWIHILSRGSYVEPSSKLQIVENIGPLVRCMVNDTERTFFKSNKHWRDGIAVFVYLLSNVTQRQDPSLGKEIQIENMNIVEALLKYDGLLRFIIQMGFWRDYRPDIVKELKSGGFVDGIVRTSGEIIQLLMFSGKAEEESRIRILEIIGSTSIVNKEYDPNCTSYTAALICLAKRKKDQRSSSRVFHMLQRLVRDADRVDKGVIKQVIDLGSNHVVNYDDALRVGTLALEMIHQGAVIDNCTSDVRTAFAIRTGLIEMCSDNFINGFKGFQSFEVGVASMYGIIECIFQSISNVKLHKKTAKAIRFKRQNIEAILLNLEHATNSTEVEMLFVMVESILDNTGSYCCQCNKSLSRTEVMQCNGCHRMSYCSKACQREDWLYGHSLTCCRSPTIEHAGLFQGRYEPKEVPSDEREAAKLKQIELSMNMIQLKLFLDHSETILGQATKLNLHLHDCVVSFELRQCPPTVEIEKYTTASFQVEDDIEGFEESRSKDNIMCVYHSNIYIRGVEEELAMQRFFPHKWLKKQSE